MQRIILASKKVKKCSIFWLQKKKVLTYNITYLRVHARGKGYTCITFLMKCENNEYKNTFTEIYNQTVWHKESTYANELNLFFFLKLRIFAENRVRSRKCESFLQLIIVQEVNNRGSVVNKMWLFCLCL